MRLITFCIFLCFHSYHVYCLCGPGYYIDNLRRCHPCSPGAYQNISDRSYCNECPSGSYSDNTASTVCTYCSAGTYNPNPGSASSKSCISCPVGSYQSLSGSAGCSSCEKGSYNSLVGQVACILCSPGFYNSQKASTTATSCIACPTGTYQPSGGSYNCLLCPFGTSTNSAAAISLSQCLSTVIPTERPSSSPTAPTHHPSLVPKYVPTVTPSSSPTVNKCPPGTASNSTNAAGAFCKKCPPGSFSNSYGGASSCTLCPAGQYTDKAGSTSCYDCPRGSFSRKGDIRCRNCSAGTFSNDSSKSTCESCQAGFYSYSGASSCTACTGGTWSNVTSATSVSFCRPCIAGYYSLLGSSKCLPCDLGTKSASLQCEKCPISTYSDRIAATTCTQCPVGTSTSSVGAKSLDNCVNLNVNVGAGMLAIFIVCYLSIQYLWLGRMYQIGYERYRNGVIVATSCFYILRRRISNMQLYDASLEAQTTTCGYICGIIKFVTFLVIAPMAVLITAVVIVLKMFAFSTFSALIIHRDFNYNFDTSFLILIKNTIGGILHSIRVSVPWLAVVLDVIDNYIPLSKILDGIYLVFDILARIKFDFSSIQIKCLGSQAPLELLLNVTIFIVFTVLIESDIALFYGTLYEDTHFKLRDLILSPIGAKQMDWSFWYRYARLGFSYLLVNAFTSNVIPHFLQYVVSLVKLSVFVSDSGHHAKTQTCDYSAGFLGIDSAFSFIATVIAYALIPIALYDAAKLLVPYVCERSHSSMWGFRYQCNRRGDKVEYGDVRHFYGTLFCGKVMNDKRELCSQLTGKNCRYCRDMQLSRPPLCALMPRHPMTLVVGAGFFCSLCQSPTEARSDTSTSGHSFWSCLSCSYHLCLGCHPNIVKQLQTSVLAKGIALPLQLLTPVDRYILWFSYTWADKLLKQRKSDDTLTFPAVSVDDIYTTPTFRLFMLCDISTSSDGTYPDWLRENSFRLPSYWDMTNELVQDSKLACQQLLQLLMTCFVFLQLLLKRGRAYWIHVLRSYVIFLRVCLGFWSDDILFHYNFFEKRVWLGICEWRNTTTELDYDMDSDERRLTAAMMAAMVKPRAIFCLIIPYASLITIFVMTTATSPLILSFHAERLCAILPKLLLSPTEAWKISSQRLQKYGPASNFWIAVQSVYIFITESRLISFIAGVSKYTLALAIVFFPSTVFINVIVVIFILYACGVSLIALVVVASRLGMVASGVQRQVPREHIYGIDVNISPRDSDEG